VYDRARDELAVPDPYATEWEPPFRHGPIIDTTLGDMPERPGALLSQCRGDLTPPNAASLCLAPAGLLNGSAGHPSDDIA
jgi:hypothetical protein